MLVPLRAPSKSSPATEPPPVSATGADALQRIGPGNGLAPAAPRLRGAGGGGLAQQHDVHTSALDVTVISGLVTAGPC